MPIGIQRINAKRQQPNTRITFIKPLQGPTTKYALDFLERIAAICHPIMLANHLSVTTLEKYEPNREFVGRNFNAGEIIQLVLRSSGGQWLSFRTVQMVMMHELAHCMQMNHGREFWNVRNQYVEELRGLWGKGYTGDGFWGRGKTLLQGEYPGGVVGEGDMGIASLCGGTFRSRRRKRRRAGDGVSQNLTYKERQERRIAKKFGTNGITLGDDLDTRVKLEDGKRAKGKPRVAGSARGRELRAKAMLARLSVAKEDAKKEEEDGSIENGSDYEDVECSEALDLNGSRLVDGKGNGVVRICEDEDQDDIRVKQEMQELQELNSALPDCCSSSLEVQEGNASTASEAELEIADEMNNLTTPTDRFLPSPPSADVGPSPQPADVEDQSIPEHTATCPICSMTNEPSSILCVACSHVFDTTKVSGTWRCRSSTCKDSQYINAIDHRLCGVCGARRPDD